MDTLLAFVNEILAHRGQEPLASWSPALSLSDDLGLDSFDLAELTVKLEDRFGIDVFEAGFVHTLGEIAARLEAPEVEP